ncbi:MAG: nitrate reductase cytochrome c-type subunit [Pseudomonadales bacterium]|nr:nitrate reductase cytochrome c-type subunit [Pseudomonadales bacterium]
MYNPQPTFFRWLCIISLFISPFNCMAEKTNTNNLRSGANIATLRGSSGIENNSKAPKFTETDVSATLRPRSYPMQAPTIPHDIQGLQINLNFNQCLSSHNRNVAPLMKVPAVGVSHYKNRDQVYLSDISPRRYFCTQCHVPQQKAEILLKNTFKNMETVSNCKADQSC